MEQLALIVAGVVLLVGAFIRIVSVKCAAFLKPPLRLQLVPVDDRAKGRFADSHRDELESLGFAPIGVYRVREMPGVVLVAFTHAHQAACAVVYRHPIAGVFVDMASMTEDDRGLTVTSAPLGGNLDQPPGRAKVYLPEGTVRQLYDRLLAERPQGAHRRLDASNFVRVFETEYAREMEWRAKRGGPTQEEVRREAHAMGIKSEKTIQQATDRIRKQYSESSQPGVR